jgi:hypothetical protein
MCDPFNTSTEAALWDERNDLDPFLAEHYATNAQHELNRALAASHPDQQRITRARRLLGTYHGLAALARLPENCDFDNFQCEEAVDGEGLASVPPDRVARMGSAVEENIPLSPTSHDGSVSADGGNGVLAGDDVDRSRSRESSVESITREDSLNDRVHGQQDDANHNNGTQQPVHQQQVPQQRIPQQRIPQQQILQRQILEQQIPQQMPSQQMPPQQMTPQQVLHPHIPQHQIYRQWPSQQWAPPPVYQPPPQVYHTLPPQQTMEYYHPQQQMTGYYQPPSQSMGYYQSFVQSMMPYQPPPYQPPIQLPRYQQPSYPTMAPAIMQNITQYSTPVNITINLGPTVIHQYGSNIPQPQQYGPVHGSYDGGYDEILGGRRTRRGRRSRRGKR